MISLKKNVMIFGAFVTVLLMISTATAVERVTSEPTINYFERSEVTSIDRISQNTVQDMNSLNSPLQTSTFETSDSDGWLVNSAKTYASARDGEKADSNGVFDDSDNLTIGQTVWNFYDNFDYDIYYISRGFVYFDTSSIPSDATISSAILKLCCYGKRSDDNDYDVVIQNGQPDHPEDPMVREDFNRDHYSGDGGSKSYSSFTVDSYNDISITELGWIKKGSGAQTKLCLRTSNDIDGEEIELPPDEGDMWKDMIGFYSEEEGHPAKLEVTYSIPNDPPSTPSKPSGPDSGNPGVSYTYKTSATDPEGDQVYYKFDWGDGTNSGWVGPYDSGEEGSASHSWTSIGTYYVKAKAKDTHDAKSEWSAEKKVVIEESDNNPPNMPKWPSPINGSENIPLVTSLEWYCIDPDSDDITYDIYICGCPKPDYCSPVLEDMETDHHGHQEYEINLSVDQPYYWRIVATDEHGAQTVGPIWEFSTQTIDQCDPIDNSQPDKPVKPLLVWPYDQYDIRLGDYCIFATTANDSDGDNVNIYWDMDEDNSVDFKVLNVTQGEPQTIVYPWDKPAGWYNVRVIATDKFNNASEWSDPLTVYAHPDPYNNPPEKPKYEEGVKTGHLGKPYTYIFRCYDDNSDELRGQWDFGDGTITDWNDSYWINHKYGNYLLYCSHIWDDAGNYDVRMRTEDLSGERSPWSDPFKVSISKKKTATVFNHNDFMGMTFGDVFENLPGQGRLIYANGSNGAFVTAAFGGFPIGHAWSTACQGVQIYVGREKELTINAEISHISATEYVLPAYTWLQKVIKIGNFYKPEQEHKEWLNNILSIEDLQAFSTGTVGLLGSIVYGPSGPINLYEYYKTVHWTARHLQYAGYSLKEANDILNVYGTASQMGNSAKESYTTLWNTFRYGFSWMKGAPSSGVSKTVVTASEVAGEPIGILGPFAMILIVADQIWTLYQLMNHWQIDTLLEKYEHETNLVETEHVSKTFTLEPGAHEIWAGMQSDAGGLLFAFGFAYSSGMVKSVTIDGYSPPETPSLGLPIIMRAGLPLAFRPYCIDQNDDPVQYIIDWGDGTTSTTDFFESGEEGLAIHKYDYIDTYTITIKSKDCDKLESEPAEYTIVLKKTTQEQEQQTQEQQQIMDLMDELNLSYSTLFEL